MLRHALIVSLLTGSAAVADPDVLHRIRLFSARLEQTPSDVSLLVARARLFHADENWQRALADVERALELEPDHRPAALLRAATLLRAGRHDEALELIAPLAESLPHDPRALVVHGRVLAALGHESRGADRLGAAIALLDRPSLDLYVERARWMAASGDVAGAMRVLDAAAEECGGLVSLALEAVRIARAGGAHVEVLRRLDALIERSARPERLLAMKADALVDAGRLDEARTTYAAVVGSIDAMPARLRGRRSFQELRRDAAAELEALAAPRSNNGNPD